MSTSFIPHSASYAPLLPAAQDPAAAILDARHDARVAADFEVALYSRDFSGPLGAQVRDISVSGICIATPSIVALSSLSRIVLHLPTGRHEIAIEGRWQSEPSGEESVLSGVAFSDLCAEEEAQLWEVVHDCGRALARFVYGKSELRELGREDAAHIAQASRLRRVPRGRTLYEPGDTAPANDSVFIVRDGAVTLSLDSAQGTARELGRLSCGDIFGGLPMTAAIPNIDRAIATEDTTLVEISGSAFAYLRLAQPLSAQRLTKVITRRHIERLQGVIALS
jgi:hypothetical protein